MTEIHEAHRGQKLPSAAQKEWDELDAEYRETERELHQRRELHERLRQMADDPRHREGPLVPEEQRDYAPFASERQTAALRTVERLYRHGMPERGVLRLERVVREAADRVAALISGDAAGG
jgi:hypothetical protein